MNTKFEKADEGKAPLHNLRDFPEALKEISYVLQFGADKYGRRNWSLCEDWDRYFSAADRHILDYFNGIPYDQDTSRNHLAHAICCLLFILEMDLRKANGVVYE